MFENRTVLKFIGFENMGNHIVYNIGVKDASNQTYQLQARYKTLRDIYTQLKETVDPSEMPDFPPKRLFGNMNVEFVSQRQKALENFFNNLLQKHSIDNLKPLKDFLINPNPKPKPSVSPSPNIRPDSIQRPVQGSKPQPASKLPIKIIEQYKGMFFDLSDKFSPPEMEDPEVRRKRNEYQGKIKLSWGINNGESNLPAGNQNNLINIRDDTLVSHHPQLFESINLTLDTIKQEVENIKLPHVNEIIINLQ